MINSLLVTRPKLELPRRLEDFLNQPDDPPRRDEIWIGHVVGSERRAALPQIKTRLHKIRAVRNGVHVVINLRVTLDFAEIVARAVMFIERNPQPPDVLAGVGHGFFAQRLGAAVKTARRITK